MENPHSFSHEIHLTPSTPRPRLDHAIHPPGVLGQQGAIALLEQEQLKPITMDVDGVYIMK